MFGYCSNNGLRTPSSFSHRATERMLLGSNFLSSCSEKKVCPIIDIPNLPFFACTQIISFPFKDTWLHFRILFSPSGMIIASTTLLPLCLEFLLWEILLSKFHQFSSNIGESVVFQFYS